MLGFPFAHWGAGLNPFSYQIPFSCIFEATDSQRLSRNPSSNPDDTTYQVTSFWFRRLRPGTTETFLSGPNSTTNSTEIRIVGSIDRLGAYYEENGGVIQDNVIPEALMRDTTAWMHVFTIFDSDQATASNRLRVWLSGNEVTVFNTANYPGLGVTNEFMRNGVTTYIGYSGDGAGYRSIQVAEFIQLDGVTAAVTDFGKFDVATGIWVPVQYTGSFGTNGYHLDFADSSDLGKDVSGNGNDWTNDGSNLTAANQVKDSPTNMHPNMNYVFPEQNSFSNLLDGNLTVDWTSGTTLATHAGTVVLPESGKYHIEVTVVDTASSGTGDYPFIGALRMPFNQSDFGTSSAIRLGEEHDGFAYQANGDLADEGTVNASEFASFTDTDVIGLFFDMDNRKVWFSKNGVQQGSGSPDPATNTDAPLSLVAGAQYVFAAQAFSPAEVNVNFGQKDYTHSSPSGFGPLSVSRRPDPAIGKASDYFEALGYAGDGTSPRDVTGLDFQPDIVWIKVHDSVNDHNLSDSVRGAAETLFPNATSAETANNDEGYVSAFNSDGFELTAGSTNDDEVNDGTSNYIAWCWKEGSIPGLDIVGYTGTGANRTVAHSLGDVPELMWIKNRDNGSQSHIIYHKDAAASPETGYLQLNAQTLFTVDATAFNDTAPTDSVFTVGTANFTNLLDDEFIAYLFKSVPGFSRFGKYIGNGIADGIFQPLDFRPRFLIIKKLTSAINSWGLFDSARSPFNEVNEDLFSDLTAAQTANSDIDFTANGFKLRSADAWTNTSGAEYLFMAWAEFPAIYGPAF